ncbi:MULTISPECIES: K(+)-transporting ATPase subunit F [Asticcacaulis]|jgi:K+-transporting ATPase KdpF subunit|nr:MULTISPECIES: K(+)-transporting ATPase subunit F [Asticcacaulis]WAC49166.1 K(+)-transporting ATPase subunit F [Asticcacaulis sp. SL142]WKL56969.1 K(+)-transporting ATPase subunit F [Asticcacaulis sp. ZE23SCel15]
MIALYIAAGLVTVALAGYLIVALIKPELFP